MDEVLCTLALPPPFGERVGGRAIVRILGAAPSPDQLSAELGARPADVLCVQFRDRVDARVVDAGLPRLRGVCVYGAGYDNVDVGAATARGVAVGNTPGVVTDATADLAMALLLATARRVVEGDSMMRAHEFQEWSPTHMLGMDLAGALLGIIGFGRVGQAVARRAAGFGMRIGAWGPRIRGDARFPNLSGIDVQIFSSMGGLLELSDVISLHPPLTDETRHLFGAAEFRRMRSSAVLINTARGEIVDEVALVRALREGWIAGAGLDVYEAEPRMAAGLADCRTVVLTPHIGSATVATRAAMAEATAANALAVLAGRRPRFCVNREVELGHE